MALKEPTTPGHSFYEPDAGCCFHFGNDRDYSTHWEQSRHYTRTGDGLPPRTLLPLYQEVRRQRRGSEGWESPVGPRETGTSPLKCHPGVL